MTKLDIPAYIKLSNDKGDVLLFGKSPEIDTLDQENGVARFGGTWRSPSYLQAYFRAADILVTHGVKSATLDDICLPAFYMQRHVLELLVKRFITWVYEYADFTGSKNLISKSKREKLNKTHRISELIKDLGEACEILGFAQPPKELETLISNFESFEVTSTWARYEFSEFNKKIKKHNQDEIIVPIVSFQNRLEFIVLNMTIRFDGVESYENELYYAWQAAHN